MTMTFVFRLLRLLALALCAPGFAHAQFPGGPFFLLSDASYGSEDSALVRLETLDLSTVAEYGGADVYVYRVDKPLEFLQRQRNLHRVDTKAEYAGPGLANAASRIWDNWWSDSRAAWRRLFSQPAREAVLKQAPDARTHPRAREETPRTLSAEYKPLKGHELVASFRYPVDHARPIAPPAGVKLTGSSSEFIKPIPGNVMIPIGKQKPGLYLVEAMVGAHRANTLVFVSDTIAITKVSAKQMLVWVVNRRDGKPSSGARATWTDGVGVLQSGATDAQGLATFERAAPEKTYVFGEDGAGGVFIAESFYYDSEIYNTKLYAVTDRPLYRPGDQVFVKFLGRAFKSARESSPIAASDLKLQVLDANGFPVATQSLRITPDTGADTSFRLPENAVAGGYELRFTYQDDTYGAAFRVAEYQKPHFEINVLGDKRAWKTGEAITGKVQLTYADGKPVPKANAELLVRAQRLTMIEGDLGYSGEFPVKLSAATLTTDANGFASFTLPAASDPSRYVVSVLATDGAAYRVRATKEILVERGAGTYVLRADRGFSAAGETVTFTVRQASAAAAEQPASSAPATWEWIRLADRARNSGKLSGDGRLPVKGDALALRFDQPGSYTVQLRDAAGNVLGGTSHHVSGQGVGAPQGSIEIVFDKAQYNPGETASALITFPQPVEEALATLERDKVEKTALLAGAASGWVRAHRLSPTQWRAEIPVVADYDPNITFSVVYAKDGEYVFQNHGIKVARPRIEVSVAPDKPVYAPGDTVTLDLVGRIDGKPAADANVTLSVVDEMIYVLAPEIAPDIFEFFYHPRRNNVRTQASLNFVGYDLARPPSGGAMPTRRGTPERAIKVLERPRRDETDTALWLPTLKLDRDGKARVTFKMPDSLTRWRVTVRAADRDGAVGQQATHVRSDKAFYLKWASPNWLRSQDEPTAAVAIFNQGTSEAAIELNVTGAGLKRTDKLTAKPGANFVRLPLKIAQGDAKLQLQLSTGGKAVDALEVGLDPVPVNWSSPRVARVPIAGDEAVLALPADASAVRVQLIDSAAAQFRRVIDDLLDYPYGCVEQTASRLVPYSIALQSLAAGDDRLRESLTQRLHSHRFRLAQLAGPQATFGWWSPPVAGDGKDTDPLLTAYAYFADWHATRALKLDLPPEHWQRLLAVYRKQGADLPPLHRALMLYWMQEIGMPVGSLAAALNEELDRDLDRSRAVAQYAGAPAPQRVSTVLATPEQTLAHALARVLGAHLSPAGTGAALDAAVDRLKRARMPMADALLLMTKRLPVSEAGDVLDRVRADMPTIDRALTLVWLQRALSGTGGASSSMQRTEGATSLALTGPWSSRTTQLGERVFQWPAGQALPKSIKLTAAPPANAVAIVQYESREPEKSSLPVSIERRLYRLRKLDPAANAKPAANATQSDSQPQRGQGPQDLVARAAEFTLEPVGADEPLRTDELYLDEVVLTPTGTTAARFGIVEVPLPPGANADRSTWGISIRNAGAQAAEALERARFVESPRGYAVPIERLDAPVTVRHLVRVAQAGTFALPAARYYRMYEPEQKAFEERHRARVVVR